MATVNVEEACLSDLVDKVASGEDVVLLRDGKAVVKMTALNQPKRKIVYGLLKGKVDIPPDFDAPLSDEELRAFEGR